MTPAPLYVAAVGVCVGVATELLFQEGWRIALVCICVGVVGLIYFLRTHKALLLLVAMFFASCALGAVRTEVFHRAEIAHSLAVYAGGAHKIVGTVVSDPDVRDIQERLIIAVSQVDGVSREGTIETVSVYTGAVAYGDTVTVAGALSLPAPFTTDTGRVFDYPGYLRVSGVSALMERAHVLGVVEGSFSLPRLLFSLKHHFDSSLERALPEPEVSLMKGLLLGEKSGLSKEVMQTFVRSSLVHVVVLSGYNISIIAEALFRVISFLPTGFRYGVGSAGIVLFALMTGGGAATVRACIMALIAILARYVHRQAIALRSLAVAVTLMVLWNPATLLFDPGFVLSVLATFGLITLSPRVELYVLRVSERAPALRSIVASTVAVQLFVLPALLYYTGVFSLVALPANVLGLPLIPLTMLLGSITGVVGLVSSSLATLPALCAQALLVWLLCVARYAAAFPGGTFVVRAFPVWVLVLAYVPLTYVALSSYKKELE